MAKRAGSASRETLGELEQAFAQESISVGDLVRTVNEARKAADRYSPKTGEALGPDHAARFKAAEFLFALKGLPHKGPPPEAPAASILQAAGAPAEEPLEDPLA